MARIKKAVIPAAGFGTRFLPVTKATPKEMLPIVDKPTIQYIVEEALASGIAEILIISGHAKRAIEDHFDSAPVLERELEEKGKKVITEVLEFRCLEAPPLVAQKLELQPGDRAVKLTRLRYAGGAFQEGPVVLTTSYLLESLWPKIQSCNMERESLRQILKKNHCERNVLEKEITIHCLEEREARLLGEIAGTDVIEIDTIAWDKNGKRMEYCESLYPAGRNRFLLRIRK